MSNDQQKNSGKVADSDKDKSVIRKVEDAAKAAVDAAKEAAHMRDTMKGPPGPEDD
jgi:hypothetical protein